MVITCLIFLKVRDQRIFVWTKPKNKSILFIHIALILLAIAVYAWRIVENGYIWADSKVLIIKDFMHLFSVAFTEELIIRAFIGARVYDFLRTRLYLY